MEMVKSEKSRKRDRMWEGSSSISRAGGTKKEAECNNSTRLKLKNRIITAEQQQQQQQEEEEEDGEEALKLNRIAEAATSAGGEEDNSSTSMALKLKNKEEGGSLSLLRLREWRKLGRKNSSCSSKIIDLGNGSEVVYFPNLIDNEDAWRSFDYLNNHIPWTRPTLRVFGRSCVQPRDSCYVASDGLPKLVYSGYQPHPYSWHHFPPLHYLLQAVEDAVPGSRFNSLLLNRYKGGNDYVGWHSDDEALYGPTPLIASLSFGCERHFFLKKKLPTQKSRPALLLLEKEEDAVTARKRSKKNNKNNKSDQHSFTLKHGSLLVMRGYTQRDWIHSVPKRAKIDATRINLTFRLVL